MRLKAVVLTLWTLGITCSVAPSHAAPDPDRLLAAMVFNLIKFVRWPDRANSQRSEFYVCLADESNVATHLGSIHGRKVDGRTVVVVTGVVAERRCQVLIVDDNSKLAMARPGTLSIGHSSGFLDAGGMIGVGIENKRIVFDVNLGLLKAQSLELSAEVLALARTVR